MADVNEIFEKLSTSSFEDMHFTAAVAILRAQYAVSLRIDGVLSTFEMSIADWTVLTILKFAGEEVLQLGEIAELLKVHASTATYAVERLERGGYVNKISDLSDRRTTYVTLSAKGERRLAVIQESLAKSKFGVSALSFAESEQLVQLLSKVRKRTPSELDKKISQRRIRKRPRLEQKVQKLASK